MRSLFASVLGCVLAAMLIGCGGGGGSSAPATTRATFDINWSARSRAVPALSSPLSAIVTLKQASSSGSDVTFTINRNAAPAAYNETITTPSEVRVGTETFRIEFHALADGGGDVVGIAETPVTIAANGSGIGSIAVNWKIVTVEIPAGQVIKAGERKDLQFQARDSTGTLIAVTPGSVFWQITGGSDKLRITDGQPEGILPGQASLTATIDTRTSLATSVRVGSDTAVALTPSAPTLSIGAAQIFTATVTNAPNVAVTWSIEEGAGGGTISAGGAYTAPQTPGTYHVRATSQYDTAVFAAATITVVAGGASGTIQ